MPPPSQSTHPNILNSNAMSLTTADFFDVRNDENQIVGVINVVINSIKGLRAHK